MLIVPLRPLPNQTVSVQLAGQVCQIDVFQKSRGLFLNLYVSNVLILGGAICQNLNRVVRSVYLGFSGDLAFIDNQGNTDPVYTGLGTRYSLAYVTAEELDGEG